MFFLYCLVSCLRKLLLLKSINLIKADEYFRDPWNVSRRGPGRHFQNLVTLHEYTVQYHIYPIRGPNPVYTPLLLDACDQTLHWVQESGGRSGTQVRLTRGIGVVQGRPGDRAWGQQKNEELRRVPNEEASNPRRPNVPWTCSPGSKSRMASQNTPTPRIFSEASGNL